MREEWGQGVGIRDVFAGIAKALAATLATNSKLKQEQTHYLLQIPVSSADHPYQTHPPTSAAAHTHAHLSPNREKSCFGGK